MDNNLKVHINLDNVLFRLFCLLAFSLPFELALEILFEIDTIFKPFRVVCLAIIGVFVLRVIKQGLSFYTFDRPDIFLYLIFVYGIIASAIRMIAGVFGYSLFYNDLFQLGLLVATFFIFKSMPFSRDRMIKIFRFFIFGITINSIYIFNEFVFLGHHGRQAGFTDNPNYGSLGVAAVLTYLMLKFNYIKRLRILIAYLLATLFFFYIFIIEGSRTGLVIFTMANVFLFFFYSFRKKMILLFGGALVIFFLIFQNQQQKQFIGGPLNLVSRVVRDIDTGQEDVRFEVWRGVFRMLEDKGYWGLGIGQYKYLFANYYGEDTNQLILRIVNRGYYLSTHNDFLAILTDYGFPGVLFYILFLYFTMRKLILRMIHRKGSKEDEMYFRLCTILFACLIIFGLAAENFQHPLFWFLLGFSTKEIAPN